MKTQLYVQSEEDYQKWIQENTMAMNDEDNQSVAMNPIPNSDAEFLAPYAKDMGVNSDTLAQLKPHENK
jgi:cytochrome c oxidase subunit 2